MTDRPGKKWLLAFIAKDIEAIEDVKRLVELRAVIRANMKMFGVKERRINDRDSVRSKYEYHTNSQIAVIESEIRDVIRTLPIPVEGGTLDKQIETLFKRSRILTDMKKKVEKVRL